MRQVVRLVELCPDGSAYRDAVRPEKVCASLCCLYERRREQITSRNGLVSSVSWILQLAARAALAVPDAIAIAHQPFTKKSELKERITMDEAHRLDFWSTSSRSEAMSLVVRCGGAVHLLELLGTGGLAKGESTAVANSVSLVFDCVNRASAFATLQDSGTKGRFFRPCVNYLLAKGSVKGLLSHALRHGKRREAEMLIKMWQEPLRLRARSRLGWTQSRRQQDRKSWTWCASQLDVLASTILFREVKLERATRRQLQPPRRI